MAFTETLASLERVFNHLVLPPQLPGGQDDNIPDIGYDIMRRIRRACGFLKGTADDRFTVAWAAIDTGLSTISNNDGKYRTIQSLRDAFEHLRKEHYVVPLYITEQNAGLLMYRYTSIDTAKIVFEAFEASPLSKDILSAQDALQWHFPDRAVEMPAEEFFTESFQHTLATFLDNASSEHLPHLADKAHKAGRDIAEVRNAGSPALITKMLLSLVQGIGGPTAVHTLKKRVRDDVSFGQGEIPWRRLPVWLVLKVAMQRQLQLLQGGSVGYAAYKIVLCTILSQLLDDCIRYRMLPALVSLLQKKLGRKLAKLEARWVPESGHVDDQINYKSLIGSTAPTFKASINQANTYVKMELARFKDENLRRVPLLPLRASQNEQHLSLPNSKATLEGRLSAARRHDGWLTINHSQGFDNLNGHPAIKNMQTFTRHIYGVMDKIDYARDQASKLWKKTSLDPSDGNFTLLCNTVSKTIMTLLGCMQPKTSSNMAINSRLLLEIFDHWAVLDAICIRVHPLLAEYHPMFSPELVNVLQLPDLESMSRLRRVQKHMHQRIKAARKSTTVFSQGPGSFGIRFASSSPPHKRIYDEIMTKENELQTNKTFEWERECQRYDQLSNEYGTLACKCSYRNGEWSVAGCNKCYKKRERNRMEIEVHEDFLPKDRSTAMAIVFELSVPSCFAMYRNSTWKIATSLAYPTSLATKSNGKRLANTRLAQFGDATGSASLTMASSNKSFQQTHYRTVRMKCDLSEVLLPFAYEFKLFDTTENIWVHDLKRTLTIAHYCRITVPEFLSSNLPQASSHPPAFPEGPSSYDSVANRRDCPAGVSSHEFEAHQRVLSGTSRRWPTILVELGSSNVDFGKEDTVAMFSHLVHQAGPMLPQLATEEWPYGETSHAEILGGVHSFLQDEHFIQRLTDEIERRFIGIEHNWRETSSMEILIILLIRTMALNANRLLDEKLHFLLQRLRAATLAWTVALREEVMAAIDDQASKRASAYAFRAALLCRRTYVLLKGIEWDEISAVDLETFVRASIALQQNLTVKVESLGETDIRLLKFDVMMCHGLDTKIQQAMKRHCQRISGAILENIGLVSLTSRDEKIVPKFDTWRFLEGASSGWILSKLHFPHPDLEHDSTTQHISLHMTQGYLLVDGKTIGKLPDHIRNSVDVKEIFGDKHFLTFPSEMPGMSYRLASLIEDHMIQIGLRSDEVIIVSMRKSGEIFEYVPRRVFTNQQGLLDLPRGLVEDCFHWLDIRLGQLEIRRSRTRWSKENNDWTLNISSCQAHRPGQALVDPHSETAALICQIFDGFEDTQRLTIFQPIKLQDTLSVELRHLELSFFVNNEGTLQCRELGSVVDSNQDAGTLYGYQSMIVLREVYDPKRRSLIAPLGEIEWKRSDVHISVRAIVDAGNQLPNARQRSGRDRAYARFEIDTILGRLTCPPEPRLLFTKAQLHAFTSFPLPDPLTGRTGEEEAFHTLMSGRIQPWLSLPEVCFCILGQMELLVPQRSYYPLNLKVIQKVAWDERMPIGLQNDRYRRILHHLVRKADLLRHFEEVADLDNRNLAEHYKKWGSYNISHLETRGEIQRMRYECPRQDVESSCPVQILDLEYVSRGCCDEVYVEAAVDPICESSAVFQVVRMLRDKPRCIPMSEDISTILGRWAKFGGFFGTAHSELPPISSLVCSQTLQDQWGKFVETACLSSSEDMHRLMFTLSGLAFCPDANLDLIRLLAAYCYMPELRAIELPTYTSYSDFVYNKELADHMLTSIIASEYMEYVAETIQATGRDAINAAIENERAAHKVMCSQENSRLAGSLMLQWPERKTPDAGNISSSYIDVDAALEKITVLWQCLYRNRLLSHYVRDVEVALIPTRTRVVRRDQLFHVFKHSVPKLVSHEHGSPSLRLELCRQPFLLDEIQPANVVLLQQKFSTQQTRDRYVKPEEFVELKSIVSLFKASSDILRCSYGQDLASSLKALEETSADFCFGNGLEAFEPIPLHKLQVVLLESERDLQTALQKIKALFSSSSVGEDDKRAQKGYHWLQAVGLWPRLTPVSILELLRSQMDVHLEQELFHTLIQYGKLITSHQRLSRLFRALVKNDERRIQEELANGGHQNWKPADYPDWLLLEIDSNMLIRDEQVTVAKAMISPASGENSVFQLNMGKGKTSMIVPMVMCVLADGKQLARLGVPKALLLPTAQVLQSRLGGLVGREVRQVPFSRRLLVQGDCRETFTVFRDHHEDLTKCRGILIGAPEHFLAFKLSGEQCYLDGRDTQLSVEMMQFQAYLRNTLCRDVLDESDFTLAVRTQLVYPSGTFTAVDGTPYRWELVQTLLSLLESHVMALAEHKSRSINVVKRPGGGFPLVYILDSSIEDEIRQLLVQDIVQGRVPFFRPSPLKTVSKRARSRDGQFSTAKTRELLDIALCDTTSDDVIMKVAEVFADPDAVANGLLLMRGLLHHDILLTCLKKRWNVQYGLHPKRWPIAVPYEARGVPSERSEFGHPDVTVIFTCLAFYYAGVNIEQFRQGLGHVLHHVDDPATEYEKWSAGDGTVALPEDLQNWNSINIDDAGQVEKLWKCLRFARSVVNHFLNTFVFPLYCRQFSVKLQASAWDLPIFNKPAVDGCTGPARTTGFSGTNDNKSMLPLTIKQHDLPGLQQTNAEVLTYLLQSRNRGYICTGGCGSTRWSEQQLVTSLARTSIQVFIDAGAYILEKTNESLARSWLALAEPHIKAAVYFKETDNRAWVVFRDATAAMAPLVSTPFAERLDECIVYYDEAHTRGVDLQLPADARGALTLALGQTKDHTVQAAMRLRQLGTTQSVVFYAPPEVDQSIRDLCSLGSLVNKHFVNSFHVVHWLLEQTCLANEQLGSLYASHGVDFCRRTDAMWKYQNTLDNTQSRKSLLSVLEQPERQSLKVMYGHPEANPMSEIGPGKKRRDKGRATESVFAEPCLRTFMDQLQGYQTMGASGTATSKATFEEVEQEREVEVEVEQQRSTRPRKKFNALTFPGHVSAAIRDFVETGVLSGDSGYETFFSFIAGTDIGQRHGVKEVTTRLYMSTEFQRTIDTQGFSKSPSDDFLRPVEWLLWCPSTETGIVIIPEELELLIPQVRKSTFVHLVAYAAPVTRSMLDFSSLKFYSFPALPKDYIFPTWLPIEMGILAGRLYMEYDEAMDMAKYLGQGVGSDKESGDEDEATTADASRFCSNTATFLLEWLPLRRTAQDVLHTPAAYVCQGRPLRPDHAFFSQSSKYGQHVKDETSEGSKDAIAGKETGDISSEDDHIKVEVEGKLA